jgi:hypothetical protein
MTEITRVPAGADSEPRHHSRSHSQRRNAASDVVALRAGLIEEIGPLMAQWMNNTLELGKKLKELRDTFPKTNASKYAPRPGWHECIEGMFEISPRWATNLINAYEKFGPEGSARTELRAIPSKVMLLLAAPSVPEAAVEEVLAEAERGTVSEKQAKRIVKKHKPQRPLTADTVTQGNDAAPANERVRVHIVEQPEPQTIHARVQILDEGQQPAPQTVAVRKLTAGLTPSPYIHGAVHADANVDTLPFRIRSLLGPVKAQIEALRPEAVQLRDEVVSALHDLVDHARALAESIEGGNVR